MADMPGSSETSGPTTGQPLTRFEDADLLLGRGRFGDDLPVPRGTLHAAILRSPHPHAELVAIDAAAALALPGIACVVTGEDAKRFGRSQVEQRGIDETVIDDDLRFLQTLERAHRRRDDARCIPVW